MSLAKRITPCLWFDGQAEAAANHYVGIFPNSRITSVSRYSDAGTDVHHQQPGTVMVVAFELDGHAFTALNGGPQFRFNEAVSFQVNCRSQEEIDHYWARLGEGGDPKAQQCGWLKDRYGLSWQVIPDTMGELFAGAGAEGAKRAMTAMLAMKKIDLAALRRAAAGRS
jgi:predicted 3-demethylubiquinone-9 3-methyltransferase (glyoxalase superfamily)